MGQKLFGATTKAPPLARDGAALELAAQCDALAFQQPLDPRSHGSLDAAAIAGAEPVCRAALEKDPQLGLARAGLSVLLTAGHRAAEGLAEAKKAGEGRFVAEAVLAEQFAARRSNDPRTAHAVLEYAVSSRPGFLVALGFLGEERFELRDDAGAAGAYDRYLARSPGHPWALAQKAHALARMGRKDEAVALSRRALDAAPGDPELSLELASRLIDAGKEAEAEPILRAIASATPPRPLAGLRLGYLLLRRGRLDEASGLFRKAVADARHGDEAHTRAVAHADLARVAAQRDDYGAAVAELTAARG
ncbi:MAG: tetratricopeptide repeat protein, partial [Myxococcales bacterium]